jgi:small subunit ribosomal protein S20
VANSKSAIKRIAIAERNRLRNKAYKSAIKTLMKTYFNALDSYMAEPAADKMESVNRAMSAAYSKIDKAVKSNVLHINNGSRKKSRLAKAMAKATAS